MSSADATAAERLSDRTWRIPPFGDPSRRRRLIKVGAWLVGVIVVVALLQALGVDVRGWLSSVWDALTEISAQYLIAGWAVQTVQTTLTAVAWYFILRAGFPQAPISYLQVLAAYAAGVALNGFLPANLGTVVMLLMFVAMISGAGLRASSAAWSSRRSSSPSPAPSSILFLSVAGSFELQLNLFHDHPGLAALVQGAGPSSSSSSAGSSGGSSKAWEAG